MATSLSSSARECLLAHELAHVEHYTSRRAVLMFDAWPAICFLVAAAVVWSAVSISATAAIGIAGVLGLALLTAYAATSRHEETAADLYAIDLYAIDLAGNLDAAAELMDVYVQAREASRGRGWPRSFLEDRVWATHPGPERRLAAMERRLQR